MPKTQYSLRASVPDAVRASLSDYGALTCSLLKSRDIETKEAAEKFFARTYEGGLHDPFLLPDMEKAVTRILRAIKDSEPIVVYSDYDCDGIPGGALMHDFFKGIGYGHFENYIPHRHEEGYGLNKDAVEKLAKKGAKLLITVDCGITDVDEVAYANTLGLDVIITDHHEPLDILPPALAVVNPKRKDNQYPFTGLCGSGVAWKLICAVLSRDRFGLKEEQEKWWLDVVGLATIADMVPLTDENRLLAHYGLLVMKKNRRLGLQHLFRTMRMDARNVSEDDIGFMLAPRINAASRMGAPEDAFRLLTARTEEDAGSYARLLDRTNNERKGVVGAMVKDIKRRMQKRTELTPVLVIGDPSWRPSLVGLAANSLSEEYARPVFVWGRDGRSFLKGSCRSDGSVSVVELMHKAQNLFLEYGGHHASGGFSVREEYIHEFPERLNEAYGDLTKSAPLKASSTTMAIDASLAIGDVNSSTMRELRAFAPYGEGNSKPLFAFRNITPVRVEHFGKVKEHLKVLFPKEDGTIEGIAFFASSEIVERCEAGAPVDLVAHIEESAFMGRMRVRLRIVDVCEADSPRILESVYPLPHSDQAN